MENKLSVEHIEAVIVGEEYYNPSLKPSHTICILKLANGFTTTGESAPVEPANYDAELGKKIARDRAVSKVWELEGYVLRNSLNKS